MMRKPASLAALCARTTPASVLRSATAMASRPSCCARSTSSCACEPTTQEREITRDLKLSINRSAHRKAYACHPASKHPLQIPGRYRENRRHDLFDVMCCRGLVRKARCISPPIRLHARRATHGRNRFNARIYAGPIDPVNAAMLVFDAVVIPDAPRPI